VTTFASVSIDSVAPRVFLNMKFASSSAMRNARDGSSGTGQTTPVRSTMPISETSRMFTVAN